jgi:hypothetical protein
MEAQCSIKIPLMGGRTDNGKTFSPIKFATNDTISSTCDLVPLFFGLSNRDVPSLRSRKLGQQLISGHDSVCK